ncbi:MAG TPA: glucose-6-phosphate dehydrogenase assembly protein OpcA, partial [Marmoricola sp.]|nr:glucose-6-phosphate dehydrogenase assembly protein OpcA [Marmoricola sp.]
PARPGEDPIGSLAKRRITDVAAVEFQPSRGLRDQCTGYAPGNTDLAWARITPWRALLAAALDQHSDRILSCEVTAPTKSPGGILLRAWLQHRLRVDVSHKTTSHTGIQKVILHSSLGDIVIDRSNSKKLAQFVVPGQAAVPIALPTRTVADCLAEELRRLDEDEIYRATVEYAASTLWPVAR